MSPFFSLRTKRVHSIREFAICPFCFRNVLSICLLLLLPALLLGQTHIMTFNIRYATEADGMNQWELRKHEVVSFITSQQPDFLGVQEALPQQLDHLDRGLNAYAFIGHGRDGKNTDSEAVPLFYKKDKYQLLNNKIFWLSPTPEVPSKGWDAALPRIAVYGAFRDMNSGDTLHVINTHFDHLGHEARRRSAQQLVDWTGLNLPENAMLVLMGDLNCEPGTAPVQTLKSIMTDTYEAAGLQLAKGTFNGFDTTRTSLPRIDYIFTRGFDILSSGISDQIRENGSYLSDHFPVWAWVVPKDRN